MNGYLLRLVRRAGAVGESQPLRPFVRSASPVAERDQRIGMRGFEGFGFGESSLAEADSEIGDGQGETFPSPAPSPMPGARDTEERTVQRKMASPTAGPAASPTPGSTAKGIPMHAGSLPPVAMHVDSLPPLAKGGRGDFETPQAVKSPLSPLLQRGEAGTLVHRGEPGILEIRRQYLARGEGHDQAQAAETGAGIASHAGPSERSEPDQSRRGDGYTRSARQARQVDVPRLEPSTRTFARHTEPPPVDAGAPADDTIEGPRVVIGRVNVEVVQVPAAQPDAAAPRSGPLTAESVSVIGPLGGGVPVYRRLNLRHR